MESEIGFDDKLALFCAKVDHLQPGWRLIRLTDMKGKFTGTTLLARFEVTAVE
jgi:phosphatidylinositol phospholipase C, delta